jgi:thiol-disulfide isomerase/thioredoxin
LDGGTWTLAAARGRPVLLNFWASWCEPCRAEMPSLQQLGAQHEAKGLQIVAINFREGESAVQRFIAKTALRLPVLYDRDGAAAKALGVRTFPSTVAIGRDGKAKFVVTGEVDWSSPSVERWVEALL